MVARRLIVCLVACSFLAVAGCQKKGEQAIGPASGGGPVATSPADTPSAGTTLLDPAKVTNGGAVSGRVILDGTPPAPKPVDMASKPECVQAHSGGTPPADNLIVAADKGLKDCFVYIKKGLESYKFEAPAEAAVIDQKGCMYMPHVFGMMVQQDLKIMNSDPFSHNIKVQENNNFNLGMTGGQAPETKARWFKKEQVPVTVQCDIHSWMRSYACVLKHPYFAVTGADGKFEIKNLPPGKYTLAVWHEPVRGLTKPSPDEVEVEVAGGATQTKDFTFNFK